MSDAGSNNGKRVNSRSRITVFIALLVVLGATYGGFEVYTSQSSFCGGSCHAMTEQYEAWKADFHHVVNNNEEMQAECVDCHFLPGDKQYPLGCHRQ